MAIRPIDPDTERFLIRDYRDDDRTMIEAVDRMTGDSYEWPDYAPRRGWDAADAWCKAQEEKYPTVFAALCPVCRGSSYVGEEDCQICGGTGTVPSVPGETLLGRNKRLIANSPDSRAARKQLAKTVRERIRGKGR